MERQYEEVKEQLKLVIERLDALVRLEVRHDGAVVELQRAHTRVDRLERKVDVVAVESRSNAFATKIAERIGWILISAAIGALGYLFK